MSDWAVCCMLIQTLADGLTGWRADWLAGWLAGWLTDWLTGWLADWLTGWLTGWLDEGEPVWQAGHEDSMTLGNSTGKGEIPGKEERESQSEGWGDASHMQVFKSNLESPAITALHLVDRWDYRCGSQTAEIACCWRFPEEPEIGRASCRERV